VDVMHNAQVGYDKQVNEANNNVFITVLRKLAPGNANGDAGVE